MHGEKGFTLITLIFLLGLVIVVVLIGFKVVPAYMDYYTIKNVLENVVQDPEVGQSSEELRGSVARRLDVNFVKGVDASDLLIEKEEGQLTLIIPINRKEHLMGGVSVCVDLEAKASAPLK
jgi:hypothetical protein